MLKNKKSVQKSNKSFVPNAIKEQLFERLSDRGLIKSLQEQMRLAIAEELNGERKGVVVEEEKKWIGCNGHREDDWSAKLSEVASWERQVRSELEFERELQTKELERQKELMKSEWRKLEERDKALRIELDARERRLRLREESVQMELYEVDNKMKDVDQREKMVNEIVKIKVGEEMERLKKKFYQLEQSKINLNKREDNLKDMETKLHQQAMIVKEKIEKKKECEIELAKMRKEFEIVKKENEVFKNRLEELQDYHVFRFENNSLKNELKSVKEALKNKNDEFENAKNEWEKNKRVDDEKINKLKLELRRLEERLDLIRQKSQVEAMQLNRNCEELKIHLDHSKSRILKMTDKNRALSREVIALQKHLSPKAKLCFEPKIGCHFCDHISKDFEEPIFYSENNLNGDKTFHFLHQNASLSPTRRTKTLPNLHSEMNSSNEELKKHSIESLDRPVFTGFHQNTSFNTFKNDENGTDEPEKKDYKNGLNLLKDENNSLDSFEW